MKTDVGLKDFYEVDWPVAVKTYGNNHATLIGLIVSWWNKRAESNWALEAGPSIGNFLKKISGKIRGQCDALLCDSDGPAAVLEVEGSNFNWILEKISASLVSPLERLRSVRIGILIAYEYGPGAGMSLKKIKASGIKLTRSLKGKKLIIIVANKQRQINVEEIRRINPYYPCAIMSIKGYEFVEGEIVDEKDFMPANFCQRKEGV